MIEEHDEQLQQNGENFFETIPPTLRVDDLKPFHVTRWIFSKREGKGEATGVVYLTETALQITKRLPLGHPEGPLFRNSRGRP